MVPSTEIAAGESGHVEQPLTQIPHLRVLPQLNRQAPLYLRLTGEQELKGTDLEAEKKQRPGECCPLASFLITPGAPVQGCQYPQKAGLSLINHPRLT